MKKGCDLARVPLCRLLLEPLGSSTCASMTGPFGHLMCRPLTPFVAAASAVGILNKRQSHQLSSHIAQLGLMCVTLYSMPRARLCMKSVLLRPNIFRGHMDGSCSQASLLALTFAWSSRTFRR